MTISYKSDNNGGDRYLAEAWFEDEDGNQVEVSSLQAGTKFDSSFVRHIESIILDEGQKPSPDEADLEAWLSFDERFVCNVDTSVFVGAISLGPAGFTNLWWVYSTLDLPHDIMNLQPPLVCHVDDLEKEVEALLYNGCEWASDNNCPVAWGKLTKVAAEIRRDIAKHHSITHLRRSI